MEQAPAQNTGIRVRRKWNGKGLIRLLLIAAAIGYIGFIAYNYIGQRITLHRLREEPAKSGTVKETVSTTGFLLKEEFVVKSPYKGKIKFIAREGERVKIGAPVATVTVEDINSRSGQSEYTLYAQEAGIVSCRIDGSEGIYSRANMEALMLGRVSANLKNPLVVKDGDTVENGGPAFKIVNNLARNGIYCSLPRSSVAPGFIKKGKKIEIEFPDRKSVNPMIFEIDQVKTDGGNYVVLLGNNSFIPEFMNEREIKVAFVKKSYNGIIVSSKSLVKKDGKDGLYIDYKETVKWVPVEVIGTVGDKKVLAGIREETPYIVNPEVTREGQVLY